MTRAGRSLDPPCEKPVVLLDGDGVDIGTRRFRLHVHGAAPQVAPPTLLPARLRSQAARATAVLAMGAAVAGCKKEGIEVREHPPDVEEVVPDAATSPTATTAATATASTAEPIEVRDRPPAVAPPPPPSSGKVDPKPSK